MNFTNKSPGWKAPGIEPSETFKTEGFKPGYKPPSSFFNWFWKLVSDCLDELQTSLADYAAANDEDKQTIVQNINQKFENSFNATEITNILNQAIAQGTVSLNADTVDGKHASEFAAASHSHAVATQTTPGFMSAADKKKLDEAGSGVTAEEVIQILRESAGEGSGVDADTVDGKHASEFAASKHSHNNATTTADGFMSKDDKTAHEKLKTYFENDGTTNSHSMRFDTLTGLYTEGSWDKDAQCMVV